MGRGMFSRRKGSQSIEGTSHWLQLPAAAAEDPSAQGQRLPAALAQVLSAAAETKGSSEADLLEKLSGVRGAVADQLYGLSKEYRMLCDVAHAGLESCDDIIEQLRRRLADNIHYVVLGKLDEICALVEVKAESEGLRAESK